MGRSLLVPALGAVAWGKDRDGSVHVAERRVGDLLLPVRVQEGDVVFCVSKTCL